MPANGDERTFVRVFYPELMRDYPEVWADDALLSTWLRLLMYVDKMWPVRPQVPRAIRPRPLARLVELKLVTIDDDDRFRIRGYDNDRSERAERAARAANARWHPKRSA